MAAACTLSLPGCFFGGDDKAATPTATASLPASPQGSVPATATPEATAVPADLGTAQSLFREGRYGEARDSFRAVAASSGTPSGRADALVGEATASLQLSDSSGAIEALRSAVAAASAGSPTRIRAIYLLLKSLNDADRGDEAVAAYERAPGVAAGAVLEPYVAFEAGRAYRESGNATKAQALYASVLGMANASPALREQVFLEERTMARSANDSGALASALDGLIALNGGSAYRYERAQLSLAAGDADGYARRMRELIAAAPGSGSALQAVNELDSAGVTVDPGDAGLVFYRRGLYARAIDVLLPAVADGVAGNVLAYRAFYLAASYEDSGDGATAVRYYDLAAGSGATSAYVHRAMYWAARVTEGEGETAQASQRYVALAVNGPPGEFSEEAAFRAGYVYFETGDTASALSTWAAVGSTTSARLEYWRGRAYALSGDNAAATSAYRSAVALGPYEFHGLEAARALGEGISLDVRYRDRDLGKVVDWKAIEDWLRGSIGGGPVTREPTAACELMSVGLRGPAAAEIRTADAVATTWGSFALLQEAARCGLTDVAAQLAVNLRVDAGVESSEAPKDLLRLSYPVDFGATLKNEAKKAGVDPLFLAALVRQESFWDPSAGSTAGALGLTQVIPETGRSIAEQLGVTEFKAEDLFLPAVSLEFGAFYLGGELRGYASPLLALAAYNAGPGPAGRWAAGGDTAPADLLERIDYVETKAYVTYIYEAYAHYLLAWGD